MFTARSFISPEVLPHVHPEQPLAWQAAVEVAQLRHLSKRGRHVGCGPWFLVLLFSKDQVYTLPQYSSYIHLNFAKH